MTINDVVFAVHAAFATTVIIIQIFIYDRGTQRVSKLAIVLSSLTGASIVVFAGICLFKALIWMWFFYFLSLIKLGVTLIKYCPQVIRISCFT